MVGDFLRQNQKESLRAGSGGILNEEVGGKDGIDLFRTPGQNEWIVLFRWCRVLIASNRCGMPYMVIEGKTGFLIDPESTDQIADRLSQLIGPKQLRTQTAKDGRQIASHPNVVAEKTRTVYEAIYA